MEPRRAQMTLHAPGATDTVATKAPGAVARPTSLEALQALLGESSQAHRTMVFASGRTKLDWLAPPRTVDLLVDTSGLPATVAHEAADLVVHASASVALDDLQRELATAGQRLAIDTLVPGTTVGGLLATGLSGPLRHGFGAVRDLVIGMTIVRVDGTVASSGGRVVKNVAGFDLAKLFTGSFGTLGCITGAWFRLHAVPECRRFVRLDCPLAQAERVLHTLRHTQSAPSALECHQSSTAGGGRLDVVALVEGMEASTTLRAQHLASEMGERATITTDPPRWWGLPPGDLLARCACPPGQVVRLVEAIEVAAQELDCPFSLSGSAGVGSVFIGVETSGPGARAGQFVSRVREWVNLAGGSCMVLHAPAGLREEIDLFGPVDAIELMRRVKKEFDPEHLLAPGRFVGGI